MYTYIYIYISTYIYIYIYICVYISIYLSLSLYIYIYNIHIIIPTPPQDAGEGVVRQTTRANRFVSNKRMQLFFTSGSGPHRDCLVCSRSALTRFALVVHGTGTGCGPPCRFRPREHARPLWSSAVRCALGLLLQIWPFGTSW